MSSTTAAKKEIIDYLWDWAETHGDWAKLLVNFVVVMITGRGNAYFPASTSKIALNQILKEV